MKLYFKHLKLLMFVITMLLKTISLHGQQEASNWYFGDGFGVDFNCYPPRALEGGKSHSLEGSAVISDECGELVMYTNGDTIFQSTHFPLPGATNINGDRRATQSSLIIKKPASFNSYYVFTNDADENFNAHGLSYSEFNYTPPNLNIVATNTQLNTNNREMLTAVNHRSGMFVWIITKMKTNEFRAYRVTNLGVDTSAVVSKVPLQKESGQLKASPQGDILVMRNPLTLFSFDNLTGDIKVLFELENSFLKNGNSIEFSPNGKKLYINNFGSSIPAENGLYQFDLSKLNKTDVENSARKLSSPVVKGGLQLAPDGNIYFIVDSTDNSIGCIQNVNDTIVFVKNVAITYLAPINTKYLPTFNQSYFEKIGFKLSNVCKDDYTMFEPHTPYNQSDSFVWNFDDPSSGSANTSQSIDPSHQFTSAGCYNVKVKAYTNGKFIEFIQRIKINKLPTTNLPKDTIICKDPKILILNTAVNSEIPATYQWNDNDVNFFKNIYDPGKYWLTKTYKCCQITDTINVYFDSLNIDFEINDLIQCENDPKQNFKFKSTAKLHNGGKISWDLGNGKSANGDSAQTTYNKYGFYYITIHIKSDAGCNKSGSKPIIVLKKPEAKFYIDTTKQCFVGNQFHIIDSSSLAFGMGLLDTVHYDFGDDSISKAKKITKTYLAPNTYQIQLIASSDQECYDTLVKTVRVYENPKAGFMIDDSVQCLVGNKFIFTDTTHTIDDTVKNHTWKYGNGVVNSLDSLQVEYSYSIANKYGVNLIATTINGCKDSVLKSIYVHPNPKVLPTVLKDSLCKENNQFKFLATHFPNKSKLKQFIWDFGDSTFSLDSISTKHYKNDGDYIVNYTARTDHGCSDSSKLFIHVIPSPKAIIESSDTMPCYNKKEVKYNAHSSTSKEGNINYYYWDFANGNYDNTVSPEIQFYGNPLPAKVMLVVGTSKNCRDTAYQQIKFLAQPTAKIEINKNEDCLNNNNIIMDGSQSQSSTGFIKKYYWYTGDGNIDSTSGNIIKYKYQDTGEYKITLITKSNENCYDTTIKQAIIYPNPVTDFVVSEACLSHPNKFTDQSTIIKGSIVKWIWKLDNGTIDSSGPVINFEYHTAGAYGVSLKTVSDKACETQIYKKDITIVKPKPTADFVYSIAEQGISQSELILSNKSSNAVEYYWYADDILFSSDENTNKFYNDTVTTNIMLFAKHPSGCYDSILKSIFVAPEYIMHIPNAFTPNGDLNNEVFKPITNRFLNEFEMLIYNRWGELVFKSDNPEIGWDGKYKNTLVPEGTYIYMIFVKDIRNKIHNYKGTITILR